MVRYLRQKSISQGNCCAHIYRFELISSQQFIFKHPYTSLIKDQDTRGPCTEQDTLSDQAFGIKLNTYLYIVNLRWEYQNQIRKVVPSFEPISLFIRLICDRIALLASNTFVELFVIYMLLVLNISKYRSLSPCLGAPLRIRIPCCTTERNCNLFRALPGRYGWFVTCNAPNLESKHYANDRVSSSQYQTFYKFFKILLFAPRILKAINSPDNGSGHFGLL